MATITSPFAAKSTFLLVSACTDTATDTDNINVCTWGYVSYRYMYLTGKRVVSRFAPAHHFSLFFFFAFLLVFNLFSPCIDFGIGRPTHTQTQKAALYLSIFVSGHLYLCNERGKCKASFGIRRAYFGAMIKLRTDSFFFLALRR